jgi:glycosyltransferase involved in cell wall biosynthesis
LPSVSGSDLAVSVSVVIPSYNSARFLGQALESALAQDPPPDEVIIQDAGSTDGTAELVRELDDERIQFISERDEGQSDALNRGFARARGEWVVWLNADDVIYPGLLACADADSDLVYGDFDYIDEDGQTVRHFAPQPELSAERLLADGCYVFSGAAIFRRSLFERFGALDLRLRYAMDYDFYLRLAPHVHARYVPRTLGAFRVHGESKTTGITWGLIRETASIRRRHGGYRRATRIPVVTNQVKQVIDLATLPVRRRLR